MMGAKAQRVLIVAIVFVSCLQFLVHDPTSQGHTAVNHPFHSGPTNDLGVANSSGASLANAANRTHDNTGSINTNGSVTNAVTAVNENKEKIVFCGSCSYSLSNTCNERLKYLMGRHHLPEWKARESIMDRCGIDYYNEPYVLLHVGPHKTGTTAMQSFLYDSLKRNATYLQQDKFGIPTFDDLPGIFGGDGPMLNFAHCMISGFTKEGGQMNVGMCNKLRVAFPPFLESNYNQSRHVLIIAEDLDRLTIDHTRIQYYLRPYRRFRVVATYRRLHDWLPSWYNQIMDLYLSTYVQGKARYPSFVEWIDERYNHFQKVHAMEVAARYRNSGKYESVDIMNMHNDVPLLEDLFCHVLPFANATCQGIKDGAQATNSNSGRTHEYDRLATKAFLRKKLRTFHQAVSREVVDKIKNAVTEKGIFDEVDQYPRICLNETFLSRLLQTEMEQERKYFPQWYQTRGGDEQLRKDFGKAKHKLCSMDDEKLLAEGVFDPIFAELNNLYRNV